jgi:diguanylate cyclase (GGDEF)-like protein/PAS domain S-box-containing protein
MKNQHSRVLQLGILLAAGMALTGAGVGVISIAPLDPANQRVLLALAGLLLLAIAAGWLLLLRRSSASSTSSQAPAARDLILSEKRMRLALEAARIAIWDWDIPSGKQTVNSVWFEIFDYPDRSIATDIESWKQLVHPDDLERVLAAIDDHFKEVTPLYEIEYRLKTGGGAWKWVQSHGQVVSRAANGDPLRMTGTNREISQRREAEDALRRRDTILDAISVTAERLLSVSSWHAVLPIMLESLGAAAQASRAYAYEVIENVAGEYTPRQVGEWIAPGLAPQAVEAGFKPALVDVNAGAGAGLKPAPTGSICANYDSATGFFKRWQASLAAGQIVQSSASSVPESDRASLFSAGIRAQIVVPIHTGSHWWGFLGLDDSRTGRRWEPVEQDALRVAANVLAAAIQRQLLFEADREEHRVAEVLREIAIIFSKSLNYDNILDRLLEQAPRVVPFDGASIMLVRGERAYVARQRGYEEASPSFAQITAGSSFAIRDTPNLMQVMETLQPVIIPDVQAYPGWVPVQDFPFRCWIGSPLILEGRVEAILSLDKGEAGFYTSAHATRLSLFAGQASLALHNAQLFAETIEALEHEQKLSEITRAISSELDLSVILPAVVRLAVELAEAEAGSMAILEDADQVLSYPYLYNLPLELNSMVETRAEGVAWDTIYNRRSLLLPDYSAHPAANPRWTAAGLHAFIGVPVIAGSTCLGALSVFSCDPEHRFEARDQALVELVGRQAGVAIRNARLFEAAQRRAIEAETLRQAASAVSSALELNEVLDQILKQLESVIPYDSAAIFLVEDDHLHMKAGRGLPNLTQMLDQNYSKEDLLFSAIDETGLPIILTDAQADPRFERWNQEDCYIHGWIGLSLRVHEERIGYLTIDSRRIGAYQPSDGDLALAFADEVAIAIENARLFQQVQLLAITDPLTGLYNRRYFFEAARREFERARRYFTPLSIVLIDLDLFKQVNDTYGHLAGDRVLMTISTRCREVLREVDVAARYGGEEFIFLLPQTDLAGAQLLAERLREKIMDFPIDSGSQHIEVSASLGVAELDAFCPDVQSLIHHADLALYETKNTGRGRITIWAPIE